MPRNLPLVAALASGMVFAEWALTTAPDLAAFFSIAGVLAVLAVGILSLAKRTSEEPDVPPPVSIWTVSALVAASFLFGAASMALRISARLDAMEKLKPGYVDAQGVLVSDPVVMRSRSDSPTAESFRLRLIGIDGRPTWAKALVVMPPNPSGLDESPRLGDMVSLSGRLVSMDPSDGFERSMIRRGVLARISTPPSTLRIIEPRSSAVLRTADRLRAELAAAVKRTLDPKRAGLLLGLTIGDESLMPRPMLEAFRTTGLSHLTAVSGANLAMVLGALILLMRALRVGRRAQALVSLPVIAFFAVVTRWEPSVLRASVGAAIVILAWLLGRRSDPGNALVLTFAVLVAVNPALLWSIGFQLSFAATAGILLFHKPIRDRLHRMPSALRDGCALVVAAQLGVTPLLAFHFSKISSVALPANVLVAPLVPAATVLGLIAGVVGVLVPNFADAIVWLAGLPTGAIVWLAQAFSSIPSATLDVGFGIWGVLLAYLAVAALWAWMSGNRRWAAALAVGVIAAAGSAYVPRPASAAPSSLTVTFLDVGQGDAAVVESRAGEVLLFDGGPDSGLLKRALRRRGISRIDVVVASHGHADHVDGLAGLDPSRVRLALHPGVPVASLRRLPLWPQMQPIGLGHTVSVGSLRLLTLGPSPEEREDALTPEEGAEGSPLNDASVVMAVRDGKACALFTGDVEEAAQNRLAGLGSQLRCALMKAPHHGSARVSAEFVEAVDPQLIVVSVGDNSFGHPTRKALGMFERSGARVLRTDTSGDVTVRFDVMGRPQIR